MKSKLTCVLVALMPLGCFIGCQQNAANNTPTAFSSGDVAEASPQQAATKQESDSSGADSKEVADERDLDRASWEPTKGERSEDGLMTYRSHKGVLRVDLTAKQTTVKFGDTQYQGTPFNGDYAGPLLRVRRGDTIHVRLNNQLRSSTNLHFHGLGVSPLPPADDVLMEIASGEQYEYVLQIPITEESGLFWMHSHDHGRSQRQVMNGLSGTLIIEGQLDPFPQLKGIKERVLVLKDTIPGKDGRLPRDFSLSDPIIRTVNGQVNPTLEIRPNEVQFWRVANQSANLYYKLALEGHELHVLARDGMRTTKLLPTNEYLIPPASRVEFLVVGGKAGTYKFATADMDTGPDGDQYKGATIATMVCKGDTVDPIKLPTPDQFPAIDEIATQKVDHTREVVFTENNKAHEFYVDGKMFDPKRVDTRIPLGSVEEWTITNNTKELHVFHIHQGDFLVTKINGEAQEANGLRDTVSVPTGGSLTLKMDFTEPFICGRFVYHCHLMEHEDAGMVAVAEVYDPTFPKDNYDDFYSYVPHLPTLEIKKLAGPFELRDQSNRAVSQQDLSGNYSLVTFGYTTCTGSCTTAVPNMVRATNKLKESGLEITPYLVSVDPQRDSVAAMEDYAKRFDGLVALTGSAAQVEQAAIAFGVLYRPRPLPDRDTYSVLHSPDIFLLDPDGNFVASFRDNVASEKITQRVRLIMEGAKVAMK
ncbi:SCO family protein [Planctomycetes bacterium TBK1r]|uniref:Multicopper oxidase mco n=1 Tax=Stieleria magnilauensis TaxID=2527963 RepID=A0ABX5XUY4_9BACT|nr:Multicopper oxidase mco [Planctomycetes bacterium TBK1r]